MPSPSITSHLHPTHGFHPSSITTLTLLHHHQNCTIHLYYTLPPQIFVDPHELALRRASYAYRHWGSTELEKPAHALDTGEADTEVLIISEDTKFLVGVDGTDTAAHREVTVDVPMHLRYGPPSASGGYEEVQLRWPTAFLICPSNLSSSDHPPSHLCADFSLPTHVLNSLPPKKSCFPVHPLPSSGPNSNTILLPLGNTAHLAAVEIGTAAVILACFFWLVKVAWDTAGRLNAKRRNSKRE